MRIAFFSLALIISLILTAGSCEKDSPVVHVDRNPYHTFMFYNVENLFDTLDQPGKSDEEFMPDSEKEWNADKLFDKLFKISKVIQDADSSSWPALIGLCEVENRDVLEMLIQATSLKDSGYQIIHKESPDFRGIDVALIYKERDFELIDYKLWQAWFPFDDQYSTREILYVKGNLGGQGIIHVMVNHWPSRSGGEEASRPKRIFVAELVRSKIDSIFETDPKARIVLTGDFNDEPNDLSIVSGLNAHTSFDNVSDRNLYALSMYLKKTSDKASYKYRGNWNMLDQFVVSSQLLDTTDRLYCRPQDVSLIDREYLFEEDKTYMGVKPFRTYLGDYYHGGYSDHLPVSLRIHFR